MLFNQAAEGRFSAIAASFNLSFEMGSPEAAGISIQRSAQNHKTR